MLKLKKFSELQSNGSAFSLLNLNIAVAKPHFALSLFILLSITAIKSATVNRLLSLPSFTAS
ncbi:hypothetical protein PVK06_032637 [Gossypium arboreum]|uniref:Uncharacterized protein n=1 Tax=Gossypium arboreum TaxID=29729 RepID=A0ABR0NUE7_GOSAR|nr:hypothetical protein PVK06_032637 [Gossypium arboreum]